VFSKIIPMVVLFAAPAFALAEDLKLIGQYQTRLPTGKPFETREKRLTWDAERTALILCDVWDYHHCLNAVRRLEEFAPRLNELVKSARGRGVTIIHAPSDCMAAYEAHPARARAASAPAAAKLPDKIKSWCSRIPAEEKGVYPIDQSDGGEDDDPQEHADWARKLKSLGRNPNMPWKAQSPLIEIDGGKDFISDKGDEIWNILEAHKIDNVILAGVHVNMCVLGRPFGLRQMVKNKKNVVLVRDMTDAMYNPARWPFVDHFTGTDLVIGHIETHVCPTITSDQFLGGKSFRSKYDTRVEANKGLPSQGINDEMLRKTWRSVAVPNTWKALRVQTPPIAWYRANLWLSEAFAGAPMELAVPAPGTRTSAWLNGEALVGRSSGAMTIFSLPKSSANLDDANLLVVRLAGEEFLPVPTLSGKTSMELRGRWEARLGDDRAWSNIPLPAKFGTSPDIVFEP
jgi:nicotinamidase-related amidase